MHELNADCVFYLAVMGELMSAHPSLLEFTVAMDNFCSSLLCYHCSDVVVGTGMMPIATVAYVVL
jgi:hypothetical protein